jgi:hypothetical protein
VRTGNPMMWNIRNTQASEHCSSPRQIPCAKWKCRNVGLIFHLHPSVFLPLFSCFWELHLTKISEPLRGRIEEVRPWILLPELITEAQIADFAGLCDVIWNWGSLPPPHYWCSRLLCPLGATRQLGNLFNWSLIDSAACTCPIAPQHDLATSSFGGRSRLWYDM